MNERIQELTVEADNYAYKMNPEEDSYGRPANPRKFQQERDAKFAKLIVGECFYCVEIMEKIAHASNADIPPDYDRQTYLKTLEAVTGLMKAHFEVEE